MATFLSIIVIFIAGYLIVKKYQTQAVLFAAGMVLIIIAILMGETNFLPKGGKSTGFIWFDIFEVMKTIFAGRVGKIGLIIMAAGGFSKYMGHIGAAEALVKVTIKPLEKIHNPYVVVALAYIVGQLLNIFIPSAAGLAMLLLISMYPILVRLGVTPASAAAVIGTTACLDLGPASGASNMGAKTAGVDVASYFAQYQIPTAVFTIVTIAVLHFLVQRYFDKKNTAKGISNGELNIEATANSKVPGIYAILPMLPLGLLLVFSKLVIKSIKLNVVTAMFISLFIAIIFEIIRTKNVRKSLDGLKVFFAGMGTMFATIVTLIFAAETFAAGLKATGFISNLISGVQNAGLPSIAMLLLLIVIIGLTALLTGSGNAAFFSFASLAPDVAGKLGLKTIVFVLPMQLASGIFRSFSPVAGVIIAVSGAAKVSPFEIVKRTAIPMIGGLIVMIISSWILT